MFYISIVLVVSSIVVYHIAQKSTPRSINPVLALSISYALACVIAAVIYLVFFHARSLASFTESFGSLKWTRVALACAMVGADVGFLLGYRAGWDVVLFPITSSVSVTLVLIPVGLLLFKERISPINIIGIVVCALGLFMVNRK